MDASELTPAERDALVGLVAHVVVADGVVDEAEASELDELGDEIGVADLADQIRARLGEHTDPGDIRVLAAAIEREDARELVRTILFDVAQSDGSRSGSENTVLAEVTLLWSKD